MYLNDLLNKHLLSGSKLKTKRFPAFYPSSASCLSAEDNRTVVGSCLRQLYYRYKGYPESNPPGLYSQWIFAAGNTWEDFLTNKLKEMGIWLANSVKFVNHDLYMSGEIDILIKGPDYNEETGTGKWIVENKTFGSNNYSMKKGICGSRDQSPKPKDMNVLQSFIYLLTFEDQVDLVVLNYIDRACGGPENNKEFHITLHHEDDDVFPHIETTDFYGNPYRYIDRRISFRSIKSRFEVLIEHLKNEDLPYPDFQHTYTPEQVEENNTAGLIAKTKYEAYNRSPAKNPIGDWNCSNIYCSFSDLCKAQKLKDGHL